jgi:hypothetical protein
LSGAVRFANCSGARVLRLSDRGDPGSRCGRRFPASKVK